MKLRKILTAAVATMAIAAMSVVPAFAVTIDGYEVEMYGYRNGVYTLSSHTDDMIDSVEWDGEYYTVTFVPAQVYGITGWVESITATTKGETSETDGAGNTIFTFTPLEESFTTTAGEHKEGTFITYQVGLETGTHSSSSGAIVITPAE